jgi:2-iminobutanoate/2-iminopropanoate deaminase
MTKQAVTTDKAPAAIGPYSQAVRVGPFLFCSGQVALDPATGALVGGGIEAEVRQAMRNLGAVLAAAGGGFDDIVKTTIYLVDLADFQQVNAVYAEYFRSVPPARSTVEVAALPRGAAVEIDAIATIPSGGERP